MPKLIVNCPKCAFSFFTSSARSARCPSCNANLVRDSDGVWIRTNDDLWRQKDRQREVRPEI